MVRRKGDAVNCVSLIDQIFGRSGFSIIVLFTMSCLYHALTNEKAKQHCNSLIDKYGNEAVKPIKYKDVKYSKPARNKYKSDSIKIMNEAKKHDAFSTLATIGSLLGAQAMAQAAGVGVYTVFKNSNDEARMLADMAYYSDRSDRKNREKQK